MLSFNDACRKAEEYFKKNFSIKGIARASENKREWFFCGGDPEHEAIGNIIISIGKDNGNIEIVNTLSEEGFNRIKESKIMDMDTN